jgi:tetratricopeptide (TPR) repeat protein
LVLLIVVGVGLFAWRVVPSRTPLDTVGAMKANNRGAGYMERFEYPEAEAAFEEAAKLAPDWLPARINLGMALLNQHTRPEKLNQAVELYQRILKDYPENPYAHYCLAIILEHQGHVEEALPHFKKVTEIDAVDDQAWFHLGKTLNNLAQKKDNEAPSEAAKLHEEAGKCFERALSVNPYLSAAIYQVAMDLRQKDMEKAKAKLQELQELQEKAKWHEGPKTDVRYSEMGTYGQVIAGPGRPMSPPSGPLPLFAKNDKLQIKLRPGARWAKSADFGDDPIGQLRSRVRGRFGAVLVLLDYNRDGRTDLFLLGAVVDGGKVCDLLLRNDGEGRFTDVTNEAGLGGPQLSLGCTVGDFDNDGYPDLFVTGIGKQRLLRNDRNGRFEDVTQQAGLDKINSVCLSAAFLDLDQDGDLDLLITEYAGTATQALILLEKGKADFPTGTGVLVYLNVGEAKPANPSQDPPPLPPRFQRAERSVEAAFRSRPATTLCVTDLDNDNDLDVLVFPDLETPEMVLNDRLLRFHRKMLPVPADFRPSRWNGALVLDQSHREQSDLFLLRAGEAPLLLLNRSKRTILGRELDFEPGATDSPPLLQAQAVDIDLDGWTDIVGLSDKHKPVLLQNDGTRLVHRNEALGLDSAWPNDLVAVSTVCFDPSGFADLLVWSESIGLQHYVNQKNGNYGLLVIPTGHRRVDKRGDASRCNADAVGVRVIAQAVDHETSVENTTLAAGLGQSRQPLQLGLGQHPKPDVVRLRWPDILVQAELDLNPGQVYVIDQENRKDISCPVLFTWNGQRFTFVTDFLGASSMGELGPDRSCRPPRPEESVKIEADQLVPKDGHFILKIAEPMSEVVYLDRVQLIVLDHPADTRVYPDERFVTIGGPASQDLLAFREEIYPARARDHHGRDVTQTLRAWDRRTVDDFARRAWLGYAEEHWVELDFGDRLAKFGPQHQLILCMAGWTDYPYPESIWAATQAGVALQHPTLERLGPDGKWQTLLADAGFPAGLPRMMTVDVTGKLGGSACVVRLRTNMDVYWDQIFVAPVVERMPAAAVGKGGRSSGVFRAHCLEVKDAILETRGCAQEFSPDGGKPTLYDHDRRDSVPVTHLSGNLTRLGPVTELLLERDDRFVLFGPGDEVTVRFDARNLPELPKGWKRSYVLRTWGYSKDCGPFTATGETIEPLPFQKMSRYPYGPEEHYPRDAFHQEYLKEYDTRHVGPERHR